jgi:hypothetical protein
MMTVPIRTAQNGRRIDAGVPVPLFSSSERSGDVLVVSRDGQRFLMSTPAGEGDAAPISVILNWKPKS